MKALFVMDTLYRGGAEMQALDVCRNSRANGLDLSVVACGGGALERDFENSGIPYYRYQRRLPVDPLLIRKLEQLIRREKFDIVHTHQAVDGLHAYLASRGTGAKTVLSFHGHFPDAKNRLAVNFLAKRVAANISCSQGLLPWLREQGLDTENKFQVIYNGVDEKRLEYAGPDLREELKLPSDAVLYGMVAHFYPAERKDQMTLCRAFAKVAAAVPNSYLVLVGRVVAGAEAKHAECVKIIEDAGLSDRVFFLGQRDDLPKIISSLDIYVFSSFHEGLPIALMEAMLTRKPTILSDIQPHLEVSDGGRCAATFRTGNADELAKHMLMLAENVDERSELTENAYEFAHRTFSIEAHIRQLKSLYDSVLAG